MGFIFVEMLSFVKNPVDLETDLDNWLYALKHLTEFKDRPQYLNGPEFDPLFDLARYANLNEEERNMYNDSLKHKWDNENVMDYAIKTADQKARKEERAKAEIAIAKAQIAVAEAEKEKNEFALDMARELKKEGLAIEFIAKTTKLSIEQIQAI